MNKVCYFFRFYGLHCDGSSSVSCFPCCCCPFLSLRFHREMFLFVVDDNIRHEHQFHNIPVVHWCVVVHEWHQLLYSLECELVLLFTDFCHVFLFYMVDASIFSYSACVPTNRMNRWPMVNLMTTINRYLFPRMLKT